MYNIRLYNEEQDFSTLEAWWVGHSLTPAWKALLPKDNTYIIEYENKPVASACLYLMNVPDAAMIENLISDPSVSSSIKSNGVTELIKHLEKTAKELGYKTLICFTYESKLKHRYTELGYKETLNNVTTFSKRI